MTYLILFIIIAIQLFLVWKVLDLEKRMGRKIVKEKRDNELLPKAREVILDHKAASASILQRKLQVGYAQAARLLDIMEEQKFIGPAEGAKPREVLGE